MRLLLLQYSQVRNGLSTTVAFFDAAASSVAVLPPLLTYDY